MASNLLPNEGAVAWAASMNNAISAPQLNGFRLTLTSGTPVTTSDVTSAGTLYFTPYTGNRICLYDGTSSWAEFSSAEISIALSALTSGKNYDVFVYDNNGALAIDTLVAWTSDTARATAITRQDGVLVKSGTTTRRYVGTIRTTSTTTTEDSSSKRFVWNASNRVLVPSVTRDTTASWNQSNTSYALIHAGDASWQHAFVIGVDDDAVDCVLAVSGSDSLGNWFLVSISQDAATSSSTKALGWYLQNSASGVGQSVGANFRGRLGIGYRTLNGICLVGGGTVAFANGDQTGMLSTSLR